MSKSQSGIVWLASYPRSGNTWTRNFLNNLFAVLTGSNDDPKDINSLNEFTLWDISASRFEDCLGKKIKDAERDEIAAVRGEVQKRIAEHSDGVALIKTHNALVSDRGNPTINFSVTAGAVYIVRNPLDVTISFAHHFDIDMDAAIQHMARKGAETIIAEQAAYEVYGSWSENVMSWTRKSHPAILVMRYEDMLDSPADTFGGLVRHLLIDATETQIAKAVDLSSFARAKAQEEEKGYIERPKGSEAFFRVGRSEQWRDVLSEEQIRRVIAKHREQMQRFDYVPSGY